MWRAWSGALWQPQKQFWAAPVRMQQYFFCAPAPVVAAAA